MTLTIEVAPEVEQELQAQAQRSGQSLSEYAAKMLAEMTRTRQSMEGTGVASIAEAVPTEAALPASSATRFAALDELVAFARSLPDHRAEANLPPLDLSGSRADVYGYTEREDAQL